MATIAQQILEAKNQVNLAFYKGKVAKSLGEFYVKPILDEVGMALEDILHKVGARAAVELQSVLAFNASNDIPYKVVEFNPDIPQFEGGRYVETEELYYASIPGGPPISDSSGGSHFPSTGALLETIGYEIRNGNELVVGSLYENEMHASIVWFTGSDDPGSYKGKIFVLPNHGQTDEDALYYGGVLDDPGRVNDPKQYRPWFKDYVEEILQPEVRDLLRERVKEAIRKAVRATSVRKALVVRITSRVKP